MKNKYLILVAFAMLLYGSSTGLAGPSVLLTAQDYAVLAGSEVINIGSSIVTGDVGVSPGSSITGGPPLMNLTGTVHQNDADAQQAQSDLTTAYNGLAAMPFKSNLSGTDLGGLTLTSGVYFFSSSAQLTGKTQAQCREQPGCVLGFPDREHAHDRNRLGG